MFEQLEITLTERKTLQDILPINLLADHISDNIEKVNFVLPLGKVVSVKQLYHDGERLLQTDQLFKECKIRGKNVKLMVRIDSPARIKIESITEIKHSPVGQIIMEVASQFHLYGYHFNDNEANIRTEMVDPILKALGWRMDNNTLYREVKCKSSAQRVDYALFKDNVCRFIIEVKSLNTFLKDGERKQLMKYMNDPRFVTAKYGILTNGHSWAAYNRNGQLIHAVNLPLERSTKFNEDEEMANSFFHYLSLRDIDKEDMPQTDATIDNREPVNFCVKINEDGEIRGICAAQTFHIFIERYIGLVYKMQQNNRFDNTILFDEKPKRSSQLSKVSIDGKRMWITHDHNIYWKMGIIQQIYWENPDMADWLIVVPLYSHFV